MKKKLYIKRGALISGLLASVLVSGMISNGNNNLKDIRIMQPSTTGIDATLIDDQVGMADHWMFYESASQASKFQMQPATGYGRSWTYVDDVFAALNYYVDVENKELVFGLMFKVDYTPKGWGDDLSSSDAKQRTTPNLSDLGFERLTLRDEASGETLYFGNQYLTSTSYDRSFEMTKDSSDASWGVEGSGSSNVMQPETDEWVFSEDGESSAFWNEGLKNQTAWDTSSGDLPIDRFHLQKVQYRFGITSDSSYTTNFNNSSADQTVSKKFLFDVTRDWTIRPTSSGFKPQENPYIDTVYESEYGGALVPVDMDGDGDETNDSFVFGSIDLLNVDTLYNSGNQIILDYKFMPSSQIERQQTDVHSFGFSLTGPRTYIEGEAGANTSTDIGELLSFEITENETTVSANNTTYTIATDEMLNQNGESPITDQFEGSQDSTDNDMEVGEFEIILSLGDVAPKTYEEAATLLEAENPDAIFYHVDLNSDFNKIWQNTDYTLDYWMTVDQFKNTADADGNYYEDGRELINENYLMEYEGIVESPRFKNTKPISESFSTHDPVYDSTTESFTQGFDWTVDVQDDVEYQDDGNAPTSLVQIQVVDLNSETTEDLVDEEALNEFGGDQEFGTTTGSVYEVLGYSSDINDIGNTKMSGTITSNPLFENRNYKLALRYVYGDNDFAWVDTEHTLDIDTTLTIPTTLTFEESKKEISENDEISYTFNYSVDTDSEEEVVSVKPPTNLTKVELLDSDDNVVSIASYSEDDAIESGAEWTRLQEPTADGIYSGSLKTTPLNANEEYTYHLRYTYGLNDGTYNTEYLTENDTVNTVTINSGTRGYKDLSINSFTPINSGGTKADIDEENETISVTSELVIDQSVPSEEYATVTDYDPQNISKIEIFDLQGDTEEIVYALEGEEIDNSWTATDTTKTYSLTYDLFPHRIYNLGVRVYSNDQEPVEMFAEEFETENAGRFIPRITSTVKDDSSYLVQDPETEVWTWNVVFNIDIALQIDELKGESIYRPSRTSTLKFDFLDSDGNSLSESGEMTTLFNDNLTPGDSSDDDGLLSELSNGIKFSSEEYNDIVANEDYVFRLEHQYYTDEDYLESGTTDVTSETIDIDYHLVGLGNEELVREDVSISTAASTLSSLAFTINVDDVALKDDSYTTYGIIGIGVKDAEGNDIEISVEERKNELVTSGATSLRSAQYDVLINDIGLNTDISEWTLQISTDSENNIPGGDGFQQNYSMNLLQLIEESGMYDGTDFASTPAEAKNEELTDYQQLDITYSKSDNDPTDSSVQFKLNIDDPTGLLSQKSLLNDPDYSGEVSDTFSGTNIENGIVITTNGIEFSKTNLNLNITNSSATRAEAMTYEFDIELLGLVENTSYSDFSVKLPIRDNAIESFNSVDGTVEYSIEKYMDIVEDETDFSINTKLTNEAFVSSESELKYVENSVTYDSFQIEVKFDEVIDPTNEIYNEIVFAYNGEIMNSKMIGASELNANSIVYEISGLEEMTTYTMDGWQVSTLIDGYWDLSTTRAFTSEMFEMKDINLSEDIRTLEKPKANFPWWILILLLITLVGAALFLVWFFLLNNKYKVVETTEVSEGKASFRVNSNEEFSTLINGRELKGTQGGVESTLKYTVSGDVITVTGISNDSNISKLVFPVDEAANAKALEAFEKDLAKWETAKAKAEEAEQEFTDEKPVKPNLAKDIKLGGSVKSEIKPEVEEDKGSKPSEEDSEKRATLEKLTKPKLIKVAATVYDEASVKDYTKPQLVDLIMDEKSITLDAIKKIAVTAKVTLVK